MQWRNKRKKTKQKPRTNQPIEHKTLHGKLKIEGMNLASPERSVVSVQLVPLIFR